MKDEEKFSWFGLILGCCLILFGVVYAIAELYVKIHYVIKHW